MYNMQIRRQDTNWQIKEPIYQHRSINQYYYMHQEQQQAMDDAQIHKYVCVCFNYFKFHKHI